MNVTDLCHALNVTLCTENKSNELYFYFKFSLVITS